MKKPERQATPRAGRFYSGLFVLAGATLMLELIETRLLSVMMWYHLAFFVISAAMFGMTAGAVWMYLRRDRHTRETLSRDLTWLSSAFAVATAVSLALQITLAPAIVLSATLLVVLAELALAIALPFFFSGAAISLALTKSPYPTGRVYAADLTGAALGCLGVLGALHLTDAPSAILLTAALGAVAALLFAGSGIGSPAAPANVLERLLARPGRLAVVLAALGVANSLTPNGLQPILVKESIERRRGGAVIFERWNSFSRVIAMRPANTRPQLWGPSPRLPDMRIPQIYLNIDGDAGTTMFAFDGNPENAQFLSFDVTNLVYSIRGQGRAAIIGIGGGRDLLSARVFGFRDVTGVELNPIFVDMLSKPGPFSEFAGLSRIPGIQFVNDEGRSWFARTDKRFDVVQMSMIDTWAATGAGAFTLTENGLYTVEGWTTFLSRLEERGIFTVSRWFDPADVDETGRMISLGVASLLDFGVREPRRHVFVAASGHVATLLLSRAPLAPQDIEELRSACRLLAFQVLASPDSTAPNAGMAAMLAATDHQALARSTAGSPLDLSAPRDDRPFFFNLLPFDRPLEAWRFIGRPGVVGGNILATLTLWAILLVAAGLVVVTILIPLRSAARESDPRLVAGGTWYFALLGLGFMLVEMGLLQRLSLFLGHPIYSLSVVLSGLILTTGLGSWLSESMPLTTSRRFAVWTVAIVAYVASMTWWLPGVFTWFQTAAIPMRAAVCLAVITPAGLMMGFGFPNGLRLAAAVDERPTVWFWGINGAAGVLGSVLAISLSLAFGIRTNFLLGAACYLGLLPAALAMGFRPPALRPR